MQCASKMGSTQFYADEIEEKSTELFYYCYLDVDLLVHKPIGGSDKR